LEWVGLRAAGGCRGLGWAGGWWLGIGVGWVRAAEHWSELPAGRDWNVLHSTENLC
jgi:hypothetical protein